MDICYLPNACVYESLALADKNSSKNKLNKQKYTYKKEKDYYIVME